MPNWCMNTLTWSKEINKYLKEETETNWEKWYSFLQNIKPLPKELQWTTSPSKEPNQDLIDKYWYDNRYEWCRYNRGVKRDISHTNHEIDWDDLILDFESPWCPPDEAILELSRLVKWDITLDYYEPGMMFAWSLVFNNWEVIENIEYEYDKDPKAYKKFILEQWLESIEWIEYIEEQMEDQDIPNANV